MARVPLTVLDYDHLFRAFEAPVMPFDCGTMCAPLNGGEPVCCTTRHAIPLMKRAEFRLLRSRSDLWRRFKPESAVDHRIVDEIDSSMVACECKGAAHCARENRSLSCRTFPFFPYVTREWAFIGLAYYWTFEDRCWVMSNLERVEPSYVEEFVRVHDFIFEREPDEKELMRCWSATMRRVFSRWNRPIPLIGRDGGWLKVMPHGGDVRKAGVRDFRRKHGPFTSEREYRLAVEEAREEDGG